MLRRGGALGQDANLGEDPEWMPQTGASDSVAKPMLAMLSHQWAEIKDERKRLERWAISLRQKTVALSEERKFDAELEKKLDLAAQQNVALKSKLTRSDREAAQGRKAGRFADLLREVEGAVLTTELEDAEDSVDEMRRATHRALESAIRASVSRTAMLAASRTWLCWVRNWQSARSRAHRFAGLIARWLSRT